MSQHHVQFNCLKRLQKQHVGFTILEMIIVVAVVGILSAITMAQFFSVKSDTNIDQARRIIGSDINTVATWSQTGKTCCTDNTTPNGYGIIFSVSDDSYTIYADQDGSNEFSGSGEIIDSIDLSDDEFIQNMIISDCAPNSADCDLFVKSPSGDMYITGAQTDDFFVLTVQNEESGNTETITIDRSSGGQIVDYD